MYQALYRQYRPKTFDEVLGQEHITTTLKNQIQKEMLPMPIYFLELKGRVKLLLLKYFLEAVNCLNQ